VQKTKMSVHSDVTVVSDEDPSLEEVIVDLMRGTGLYASIKAQVAKFIENTGKLDPTKFVSCKSCQLHYRILLLKKNSRLHVNNKYLIM